MNPIHILDEGIKGCFLAVHGREVSAGNSWMRYTHSMCRQEVEATRIHVEQGVIGKFQREDHRGRIFALELAARRDTDKDQSVVCRVEHSVGAPIIITWAADEDLCPPFEFLTIPEHPALQLAIGRPPGLWRVDVAHEEEVAKEKKAEEHERESEECLLQKAKGAIQSLGLFHCGSV